MHPRLAETSARQGGVFSYSDALVCGYTRADVRAEVRSGRWRKLWRGAFTSSAPCADADLVEQHRLQVAARLLGCLPDTVAGHWSAAVVHGLPLLGRPPATPILTRSGAASGTRFVKVAQLPAGERTMVGGIRTTSLDRTVVDLSRRASLRAGVVAADAALRAGLDVSALQATAERWSAWPYGRRAVAVAEFADGRAESPLESLGRVALHEEGVDPPELQVEVWLGGRLLGRVDHLWEQYGCVGEADGAGKYDAPGVLRAEKLRQELLEQAGFVVVRYDWDDAYRSRGRLADRVRAALARGRPDLLDPRVRLVRTPPLRAAA